MNRNFRIGLFAAALILALAAFVLRLIGIDAGKAWWEIALPGIVAATMILMLVGEFRGRR